MRSALRWGPKHETLHLLGSVSCDGLRPTVPSREPSRHRSLSGCAAQQTLSLRTQRTSEALLACRCQRTSGLENLRRIRAHAHRIARPLYADTDLGLDLDATAYALDATTIDLCLSMFPWARFRKAKGAIKLHTMIEIHSSIPVFIDITHGKVHDVNVLDILTPEPGSFLVMDRGYLDFGRLYALHRALAFFVTRAKSNLQFRRQYSHSVDKSSGVRSDQTGILTGPLTSTLYPVALRRVTYYSVETAKHFVFLTNNFSVTPLTVASLYRSRWRIELFFKWIKQHLRIKRFFGTSVNSVKTQIWIGVSVYVLIAIIKKRLGLKHSLYTILQILSLQLFEKKPILSLFEDDDLQLEITDDPNQLNLWEI